MASHMLQLTAHPGKSATQPYRPHLRRCNFICIIFYKQFAPPGLAFSYPSYLPLYSIKKCSVKTIQAFLTHLFLLLFLYLLPLHQIPQIPITPSIYRMSKTLNITSLTGPSTASHYAAMRVTGLKAITGNTTHINFSAICALQNQLHKCAQMAKSLIHEQASILRFNNKIHHMKTYLICAQAKNLHKHAQAVLITFSYQRLLHQRRYLL